jgi:hypothetical protein
VFVFAALLGYDRVCARVGVRGRYYEGKEFELKLKEKTPGQLSEALRTALGMTDNVPPPWLINMQRCVPGHACIPSQSALRGCLAHAHATVVVGAGTVHRRRTRT